MKAVPTVISRTEQSIKIKIDGVRYNRRKFPSGKVFWTEETEIGVWTVLSDTKWLEEIYESLKS